MLSKTVRDASPPPSRASRNRQLTQIPASSRVIEPHRSHFSVLFVSLRSDSRSSPKFFIRATRLWPRAPHKGAESHLPHQPDQRPCEQLHHAATTGNAPAYCGVVFSLQSLPLPAPPRDRRTIPHAALLSDSRLGHEKADAALWLHTLLGDDEGHVRLLSSPNRDRKAVPAAIRRALQQGWIKAMVPSNR